MESAEEFIKELKLLGLNTYQSKVYLVLLHHESMTIRELSKASGVPYARCYDVLASLETLGFVTSVPARPKRFKAVEPGKALKTPLNRLLSEIDEGLKIDVADITRRYEERKEVLKQVFNKLALTLPNLVTKYRSKLSEPIWTVEGWQNIERTAKDLLVNAKEEFLFTVKPPPWGEILSHPYVWSEERRELYSKIAEGVTIRSLVPRSTVPSFLGLRQVGTPEIRVARDEWIPEKFIVTDCSSVLVNLRDPETGTFKSSAIFIQNANVSRVFKSFFESTWIQAEPVTEILPKIKAESERVLEFMNRLGFTDLETRVYSGLVQQGFCTMEQLEEELRIYNRKRTPSSREISETLHSLKQKGIVGYHEILDKYMPLHPEKICRQLEDQLSHINY